MKASPQQSPIVTLEQALQQAISHHQAGQLQDAECLYRAILQKQPNHPEANHNLGVLAVQVKQVAAALPHLKAALEAKPQHGQFWLSYVDALLQADQLDAARQVLQQARQTGLQGAALDALEGRLQERVSVQVAPGMAASNPKPDKLDKKRPANDFRMLADLYAQGRYNEMEKLARSMTRRTPRNGAAWKALGAVLQKLGRLEEALTAAETAARLMPTDPESFSNIGVILRKLGRLDEAEANYRRALKIKPDLAEVQANLGHIQRELGRLDEAESSYRNALKIKPDLAEVQADLGHIQRDLGRLDEAEASYRRALKIKPDQAEVYANMGDVQWQLGRLDEAEVSSRHALEIEPGFAAAYANLGNIQWQRGSLNEAAASYRHALEIKPDWAEAYSNLGSIFRDLGCLRDAEVSYRRALEIKPDLVVVLLNMGLLLRDLLRLKEAETSYLRALEIDPDFTEAYQNLAVVIAYLSDFTNVVEYSNRAFIRNRKENKAMTWEQRLYCFSYHPDLSAEEIYAEFARWGDRFPAPVVDFSAHDHTPGRRLRVGYVSPDFRRHTSRFYFEPFFANHDKAEVELFAYSNVKIEDDYTERFKSIFDHWRTVRGVSKEDAAAMIRADGIDILVDCCNHMANDRLDIFTLKPAPIQVTWLGAAWTTGLPMVDYVLSDPYMAPEGTLAREKIIRLPHFFVAYQPPEETAEVKEPPCQKNGFITFAYSGRTERLNHRTFRVWGELLRQIPDAKLILDYRAFADPPTQEHYLRFMAEHGMDSGRVVMRNSSNIFEGLNDVDILLDCFPHSGGTMLFDALWMGVPALTLASRPPVGRIGTSLMNNLGLSEWVAQTEEEYIQKAVGFTEQRQLLADLRFGMRERMKTSPVMDGKGFAKGVEEAYQQMWKIWCEGRG